MVVEEVELKIKLPKDVYSLLKEFSDRFLEDAAEDYISHNVVLDLSADLDCLAAIGKFPEAEKLWKKAEELRKKYSRSKRISLYLH